MTHPDDPSKARRKKSAEERRRIMESDSLARELGIEFEFAPEKLAPPVDLDQLRAFVRRELSRDCLSEVAHLIAGYVSWYKAWQQMLRDEARPTQ